jgi:hypothetical protein
LQCAETVTKQNLTAKWNNYNKILSAYLTILTGGTSSAFRDPYLYEVIALIDAIRDGRARERQIAEKELKMRLRSRQQSERKRA